MYTALSVLCMALLTALLVRYCIGGIESAGRSLPDPEGMIDPRLANYNHLIDSVKIIENDLKRHLGARGGTFHEKLSSVEEIIPEPVHERLRYIVTVQGRVLHEQDYEIPDPREFTAAVNTVIKEIRRLGSARKFGLLPLTLNGPTKA
jgi:hypothetical protein